MKAMLNKHTSPFMLLLAVSTVCYLPLEAAEPVPLIFDTDMGNDVDDALAMGVIHSLQSRKECKLIGVTITKDHRLCVPYIDAVNHFYGRGDIPIGIVKNGKTPEDSKFLPLVEKKDNGKPRYPYQLGKDQGLDATQLLRKLLAGQADGSVVIVQVGFSTNLARLLESKGDELSPLGGKELVQKKVKLLSVMAGAFKPINGKTHLEYNVVKDIPAAKKLAEAWPSPIIYSGFEIGLALRYPAHSILNDFGYVRHHPLPESYQLYNPTPHERPTWDLTSVLHAVRPSHNYFSLSPAGVVNVDDKGATTFTASPQGRHRYLIMNEQQQIRAKEALVQLTSNPPSTLENLK